jgi:hypothetical protein
MVALSQFATVFQATAILLALSTLIFLCWALRELHRKERNYTRDVLSGIHDLQPKTAWNSGFTERLIGNMPPSKEPVGCVQSRS